LPRVTFLARGRDGTADQASKTYEKALADYPLCAPATRQLTLLYAQQASDDQKACDLATKARQTYPDDTDIAKALGILTYRRGLCPQATELLKGWARGAMAERLYL
jgi:lipopolysaccharide biosynthesis regulator YciM